MFWKHGELWCNPSERNIWGLSRVVRGSCGLCACHLYPKAKPPGQAIAQILRTYCQMGSWVGFSKERGFICGWAPPVQVLAHKATGGFVSHCGWNSILESMWHGVPIVTWTISAEEQLNAFRMVRELGLAEELRLDYRKGSDELVVADEIENTVTRVMDRNSEVRKKVKDMVEKRRSEKQQWMVDLLSFLLENSLMI